SQADAELTKKIYRKVPVLIEEGAGDEVPAKNPWGISFSTMFHMSNDSDLFLDQSTASSLPLYEAKMMHQFDHRWATYAWSSAKGEVDTADVSDAQKADPTFAITPRYWVEERHVLGRLARVPKCVTQAWASQDEGELLAAFAIWIEAANADDALSGFSLSTPRDRVIHAGGKRLEALPAKQADWLDAKLLAEAREWSPLSAAELALLHETGPLLPIARTILDRRSPRWLMGWRDICRSTDERTVIASVVPRAAVGNNLPLMLFGEKISAPCCAALLGNLCAMVLDFVARHKVGGTHLNFFIYKQLPVLPPTAYTEADLAYIVPRVLELTYTSHDLAPWAADLGYTGAPFRFDPDRRAQLRAELDAYYARLYGLTRDELRYILDPADTHGPDYPTETFRGLKANELREFGEYRTRRLVLAAWDALAGQGITA
ncbi:MAG TPA: SAM-dependent DNA methyltransferase, partial [Opitutaceae bacterium]|nr:SAM-dependent DNA methyltransferase [Opitutaceae bacterium]